MKQTTITSERMKRLKKTPFFALVMTVVIVLAFYLVFSYMLGFGGIPKRIDTRYATSAHLKYRYAGKRIDTRISNSDVEILKGMFVGYAWMDNGLSCGFDRNISIALTNGRRNITLCPACDGGEAFQIGESRHYINISKAQRERFNAIVKKYGMVFPCV